MNPIGGIYTIRDTPQPHYWDIVFEWEDEMSAKLCIPLIPVGRSYDQIYRPDFAKKILNRLNAYQLFDKYFYRPKQHFIAFHIGPAGVYSFFTRSNVIPIIIDFWKSENLKRVASVYERCPTVFVTSREVFNYLQEVGLKLRLNHLSLSLPDKYFKSNDCVSKDIDIIQMGRSNATFDEYIYKFLEEYPNTHYVCAKKIGSEINMVSNKVGPLGVFKKRADFISLLKRSKVSLVSAPGLDEDKFRTGGFSPVTPRFLESASCGCRLIGIYPHNADFEYYGIKEVCEAITSFNEFKKITIDYLNKTNTPDFTQFLEKHLTSNRAIELLSKLQNK